MINTVLVTLVQRKARGWWCADDVSDHLCCFWVLLCNFVLFILPGQLFNPKKNLAPKQPPPMAELYPSSAPSSLLRNGSGVGFLTLHWEKICALDGDRGRDRNQSQVGTETEVNFLPATIPICPLQGISIRPLSRPRLGKISHSYFPFLDFGWMILYNLCIIKFVLFGLIKL